MLFSVAKMKAFSTHTVPSLPTQPKKQLLHATHAYVLFDKKTHKFVT